MGIYHASAPIPLVRSARSGVGAMGARVFDVGAGRLDALSRLMDSMRSFTMATSWLTSPSRPASAWRIDSAWMPSSATQRTGASVDLGVE